MGKRGKKVSFLPTEPSTLFDLLIASRVEVDEDGAGSDKAAAEQTILGGSEQTKLTLIGTTTAMRGTTMNSTLCLRMSRTSFGKLCVVTYRTASGSQDQKRIIILLMAEELG